jgi:hypothetical protein
MLSVALHAAGHAALNLAIWVECTLVPRMTAPKDNKKKLKNKAEEEEDDDMFGNVDDAQYEEESILGALGTDKINLYITYNK